MLGGRDELTFKKAKIQKEQTADKNIDHNSAEYNKVIKEVLWFLVLNQKNVEAFKIYRETQSNTIQEYWDFLNFNQTPFPNPNPQPKS